MITAVVLTKNEEKNIVDCLEALLWCDEIVVIDDNSEDRTRDVIAQHKWEKVRVLTHALTGNFAAQRNFGLGKAKGEWVLYVDVDERVSDALRDEILSAISSPSQILPTQNLRGFYIKRRDIMWGRRLMHGETGDIKLLRLAKKTAGGWEGNVHEVWNIRGNVGELTQELIHFPHPTIAEFLTEINYYTDIRAKELFAKKTPVAWWHIIVYPKAKFFVNYFLKRGFLDGIPGLLVAILMSFHSFLVRGKLWMLWQNTNKKS